MTTKEMLLAIASVYGIREEVAALVADRPDTYTPDSLPDLLRTSRAATGLQRETIHFRCGLSRSQISYYENKHSKNPGLRSLTALADGYGLPLWLVLCTALRDIRPLREPAPDAERKPVQPPVRKRKRPVGFSCTPDRAEAV
ncbi:helix-turn-helix domain-containing protein [Sagittula sp. MA-2]|jgi:transcriptional regulator with XRE-family HTH domain|uniref:helix-turn-helix domain-containing protein n=1 Tax=Sagittula sp. MA-2 TaxID=3048007 RepID=UPI0024C2C6A5|nr:helix-turn-helix domain-containing protein [Sagittula sp. MA-2]WHZ37501.1 helix-turn-helix domain-containing protein [Sagittula sp. MA-2]